MTGGRLYIVATPIGNFDDITLRAIEILRTVDVIAAEDTRHSKRLLEHFNIKAKLVAFHEHNASASAQQWVDQMIQGESVALISDAGTPLVSDPGYRLVRAARAAGIAVSPIPGPSAVIAALSAAGLPTDRFCFEGFLSAKSAARRAHLASLRHEPRTLVFYEAPHRVVALIGDAQAVVGPSREVAIARELTKQFEQIWHGSLADAGVALATGEIPQKGEFVVVLAGNVTPVTDYDARALMVELLTVLPPAAAAGVASRISGLSKRRLYDIALSLKKD